MTRSATSVCFVAALALGVAMAPPAVPGGSPLSREFAWTAGPPLLGPLDRGGDHYFAIKDPSVVHY